jgi:hypothetical protein
MIGTTGKLGRRLALAGRFLAAVGGLSLAADRRPWLTPRKNPASRTKEAGHRW